MAEASSSLLLAELKPSGARAEKTGNKCLSLAGLSGGSGFMLLQSAAIFTVGYPAVKSRVLQILGANDRDASATPRSDRLTTAR